MIALARLITVMSCHVYPPGQTDQVEGYRRHMTRVHSFPAGSPTGLAETGSLDYRLVIHLRLLSTFLHRNAVLILVTGL